jgi:hypothetical protein
LLTRASQPRSDRWMETYLMAQLRLIERWVRQAKDCQVQDLQARCAPSQVDRTLTPASAARPSRAHHKAAKVPSCALTNPSSHALRRNRERVSKLKLTLLHRHLFFGLAGLACNSLAASPQEPPSARALCIESASKRGQISPPPEASRALSYPAKVRASRPWLHPHNWSLRTTRT